MTEKYQGESKAAEKKKKTKNLPKAKMLNTQYLKLHIPKQSNLQANKDSFRVSKSLIRLQPWQEK